MGSFSIVLKQLIRENLILIVKYLSVSAGMYILIFLSMYLLIDIIGISEMYAYVITYCLVYIVNYNINLRFLFYRDHSLSTILKYFSHIFFFLVSGSLIFKFLFNLNIHYIFATLLTAIVLFPPRFLTHKFIVFKKYDQKI